MEVLKEFERKKTVNKVKNILGSNNIEKINAYVFAIYMLESNVDILQDDIFAGNLRWVDINGILPSNLDEELDGIIQNYNNSQLLDYIKHAEEIGIICRNPGDHFIPAYDELLKYGIDFKIKKYKKQYSKLKGKVIDKENKELIFLENQIILQKAFQDIIINYGKCAYKKYMAFGGENLERIYKACQNIAYNAPKTFFEAIQLLIIAHELVVAEEGCGSISFGRLDMYLYPYYKRDIENGNLTKEFAQECIIELWKKIANLELSWQNATIGGCGSNGKGCYNDITIMCMKATQVVRADQPQLSLIVSKDMPDEVWEQAIELIGEGMGFPSLFNDDICIKAKINSGVTYEDALNYAVMGCVELCIPGKEYAHTEGARINWAKILELCLHNIMERNVDLKHIKSFESFYNWYKNELVKHTKRICEFIDVASENFAKNYPVPFATSLMQNTEKQLRDLTDNGTVYNNISINCVGFATVVDSLYAIKELVYDKRYITIEELVKELYKKDDINKELFKKMQSCKKYGNDIDDVDLIAKDLADVFCNTVSNYKLKYRTGKVMAGFYTSYFHADFGKYVGNTPDGRKKYTPLSPSLSASSGFDINGPLALFNSATKIDMTKFGNGMALDIKFVPSFFDKIENRQALKTAIISYFEKGGLEVQFNVVDKKTLLEAQKCPRKYQNLIVRVSGFSANFVMLEKNLQDEIIKRTSNE